MSSTGTAAVADGMYSKLIDDDGTEDVFTHRTDTGPPVAPVRATPGWGGPGPGWGPYRLATICLATLCTVLLIAVIAVAAQNRRPPEAVSGAQEQTLDLNVTALLASIRNLQQEKVELQKERAELLAKLSTATALQPRTEATPTPLTCPPDWHRFNGSCYLISRTTRDWPESKSYCESLGGHLAIIHTAEEQTFLWDLLPRGHWNAFWFGVTDEHTEDHWKWVDGTPLAGGFWEVGEPNNHIDEDCGYIVKTRVLERVAVRSWYDAPCSMYWRFICEKEMGGAGGTAMPH
ncbi:CD209 antigen-like protein 2 [Antennarius striatus]|uniref:CD209 antigen-like protein 2 n=1 Tax=Antennarius striatus TaxID=241820 RepID=UPI0035AF5A62